MLSIPQDIYVATQKLLERIFLKAVTLDSFCSIGGGCINTGGKIKTSAGIFFLKWNDAFKFPNMFEAEAKGLQLLLSVKATDIPKVVGHVEASHHQFILMEFIESAQPSKNYWTQLGQQLAKLHRNTSKNFGLDHQNYIGSLKQNNNYANTWVEFFIEQRLSVQVKLAVETKKADISWIKKFEKLYLKLPTLLPEEKPSLLHGDLWSGNLMTNSKGDPCLIDPAVYYGNREVELAFSKLFGGFNNDFYNAYQEAFPLLPNFRDRIEIYNLYPLLVHTNLFGGHYKHQVDSILKSVL